METNTADTEKFDVLEVIGRGAFGVIRKVRRKSDGHVLCRKEITYVKMTVKEREQLQSEFSILATLNHPNIVGYFHREHLKRTQELYIYMEYCGGGDLGNTIKSLRTSRESATEEFVWRIFAQIVAALYRCHYGTEPPEPGNDLSGQRDPRALKTKNQSVTILHRDLKPENIFLGNDQSVKLGDFGLSKQIQSHDFASTYVGTPFYMSPEICHGETYNMRSDIWSLGCIMYELCTKEPPFNAKSHMQLAQAIKRGVFRPIPSIYSRELQNVISSCLKVNPQIRPDTASLLRLPQVWLARKGLEVVEMGKTLKKQEEVAELKIRQAEERLLACEHEREEMRQQMENTLRREWEVKARLEIERQVELRLDQWKKVFEKEVDEKAQEMAKIISRPVDQRALQDLPNPPASLDSENVAPQSSVSMSGEEDFPSTTDLTDLSNLSLESPSNLRHKLSDNRRSNKTPFSRSKTTFDSPADIQMGEPSPMSISSLSLSPRRNAAGRAVANATSTNIFTEAAREKAATRWEPILMDCFDDEDGDDDDCAPELISPTRPTPKSRGPLRIPTRPGMNRQATTATMQQLNRQPTLFPSAPISATAPRNVPGNGITRTVTEPNLRGAAAAAGSSSKSPSSRRLSKLASAGNLAGDVGSPSRKPSHQSPSKIVGSPSKAGREVGDEMMKAMITRNLNVGMNAGGRTKVELAQARAGGRPVGTDMGIGIGAGMGMGMGVGMKMTVERAEQELPAPPMWDPESDEMPSPFLSRTRRII